MTTTPTATRTGREYLRVSEDRSGRARSVKEQQDDNQAAADARAVTLGEPYTDNSVSASRYTTKTRGDFGKLLTDLRAGRFGADELWLWESSRGSRKVSEWVELIEACEDAGVVIHVTTHARTYDPANPRDRRSLLEDAVDSEYESGKVSTRAKRAAAANAAAGKPHGPTPYGYRRIYDPETRKLVRQEPHPDEAPVIRELFTRLKKGHSLRSIAADFDLRGIRTRPRTKDGETIPGKPFTAQHLRTLALSPLYVGKRIHRPRARNGAYTRPDTLDGAVKGTWEPLVSEELFHDVWRLLHRPERKTTRGGGARHLLSMIARCDVCGGPLSVTLRYDGHNSGEEKYQCHLKGHIKIAKAELDQHAEAAMLTLLSDPEVFDRLEARDHDDDQLAQVRGELKRARNELDELRAKADPAQTPPAHRISVASFAALEPGLAAEVEALERQEKELASPTPLRGWIQPGPGVEGRWGSLPVSTKREVARVLLSRAVLGELRVQRRPRNAGPRHIPADQRVVFLQG